MSSLNGATEVGKILKVPLGLIRPMKGQPRSEFNKEELMLLGESIKRTGQIQPALVIQLPEPDENGRLYELVNGERRWTACGLCGTEHLLVVVIECRDRLDQFTRAVMANCQSEGMSTFDTMKAVLVFHDNGKTDQEIAEIFNKKSRVWAYQHRRLKDLDPKVLSLLGDSVPEDKKIPFNSALLLVDLPADEQITFAEMISDTGMSAKKVGHLIKNRLNECGIKRKGRDGEDFSSANKFFARTNTEIEFYVDNADSRITNMFRNRRPEEITKLIQSVKDCLDNLGVVLQTFKKTAGK